MAEISYRPFLITLTGNGQTITPPTFVGTPPVQQDSVLVQPAASYTGTIIAVGSVDGQELFVINDSANTITFAASGTSHVADGATSAMPAFTHRMFKWVQLTGLWYRQA